MYFKYIGNNVLKIWIILKCNSYNEIKRGFLSNSTINSEGPLTPISGMKKKLPEEALAFLLQNNFTKEQYLNMKKACTESNANIWPNYNHVLSAKKFCRPTGIVFQELAAEVPKQNLLNHTANRILHEVNEQRIYFSKEFHIKQFLNYSVKVIEF